MIVENTLMKFGLTKDVNNLKLKEILQDNVRLKEVHIDIYPENPLVASSLPFELLLRTIENEVTIKNDGERLVLKRNDKFETYFMNVLFSNIIDCYYKILDNQFEIILNIQNTYYRVYVFN